MLSFRTRQFVEALLAGKHVVGGDVTLGPLAQEAQTALKTIAEYLAELKPRSAAERAEFLLNSKKADVEKSAEPALPELRSEPTAWLKNLRLGWIRACSFRGLAPAGEEWEFDLAQESHLLFGPNGSGKSSLMGAISWCLTGCVFRDDRPPQPPEDVVTYTAGDSPRKGSMWPDAATLPPSRVPLSACEPTYWVALELVGEDAKGNAKRIWVRRHDDEGLGYSPNGEEPWESIGSLTEVGINELDVELCILMPARATHLRFGKDPQLLTVFAQLVGLDDLEHIAEVAGSACSQLRTQATRQLKEVDGFEDLAREAIRGVRDSAPDSVSKLTEFPEATDELPNLQRIESLGHKVKALKEEVDRQLAAELGLQLPKAGKALDDATKKQLDDLPGKVSTAYDRLSMALSETFSQTFAFAEIGERSIEDLAVRLKEFRETGRRQVEERIQWAKTEQVEPRAPLLLEAAKYFPEGSTQCPVCEKDIKGEPVANRLNELRSLSDRPHLRRKPEELATDLLNALDKEIAADERKEGSTGLADRVLSDWLAFKESCLPGLLARPAAASDKEISALADELRKRRPRPFEPFIESHWPKGFREALADLDVAWGQANGYVDLLRACQEQGGTISERLEAILRESADERRPLSLRARLAKAHDLAVSTEPLADTRDHLKTAYKWTKKAADTRKQAEQRQSLATAVEPIKGLSGVVRSEVRGIVGEVSSEMESLYSKLYEDEHLGFGMLTPGHPANPDVRDELNLYLRRGDAILPFTPFTNAGRGRALALALVFALLSKRTHCLGCILQDDPVTSLDDEHRARFVDRLIDPLLEANQIVLATHYESFYESAEPVFAEAENLRLTPRRSERDRLRFEPGRLLERVREALSKPDCSWRAEADNLRVWIERALGAISSYCPKPFIRERLSNTVDACRQERDPQIATPERDKIIGAIQSIPVMRVLNKLHHNEDIKEPEVSDALTKLEICRKHVLKEIERLRALWKHRSAGRAIEPRSVPFELPPELVISDTEVQVVGGAAAAAEGQPIDLTEQARITLGAVSPLLVKASTLAPVALPGQFVLVAGQDVVCENGDLVAAKTDGHGFYLRRFWQMAGGAVLESTNPTTTAAPICVPVTKCCARRIVGVLFDGPPGAGRGSEGTEWAVPTGAVSIDLERLLGVEVHGHSLEPIALQGQIVLLRRLADPGSVAKGSLSCIELTEGGAVLKRCCPGPDKWMLLSVNPTSPEDPMLIKPSDVRSVFALAGVLFDTAILSER